MNIYYKPEDISPIRNAVVTSGTFDGVHIGHQKILKRVNEVASNMGGESVLITYWPHPRLVLYPDDTSLRLLNTFEEKAELLREQGIRHLLRIPFTKDFAQWSSETFIRRILVDIISTKKLVIGYDHRFGNNREGRFEQLKANAASYGFEVEEIPRQDVDDIGVSSTKIRQALLAGDVANAAALLGRPYIMSGRVITGEKIGRMIGFPTANVEIDSQHKLIPADGAYAVKIELAHNVYSGMLNIGYRPTVGGSRKTIEVHIFDFSETIYGDTLKIHFIQHLRSERKFNDIEALKEQLLEDKQNALAILNDKL